MFDGGKKAGERESKREGGGEGGGTIFELEDAKATALVKHSQKSALLSLRTVNVYIHINAYTHTNAYVHTCIYIHVLYIHVYT